MDLVSDVAYARDRVGLRGMVRSAYYSVKFTRRPASLIVHPNVFLDISPETEFEIDNRLFVGDGGLARARSSVFTTSAGSSVTQTGEGRARIYADSFVRIDGDFSIGNSYINHSSHVRCKDEVTIGDGCAISWGVDILDHDGHRIVIDGERDDSKNPSPIEIRDDVWIGHSASVGKGVTIHEGSVVANDSVVVSDVPPNVLVAGCPAEVVRENVSWE